VQPVVVAWPVDPRKGLVEPAIVTLNRDFGSTDSVFHWANFAKYAVWQGQFNPK
jgi:hypothetical protein